MCENLRYLNLAAVPVTPADLISLSTISQELIVLNLTQCSIFDKELQNVFIHYPHLESVTLTYTRLTGECLIGLRHAPLKELVLDGCNDLESQDLVRGLRVLKGLNRLSLNDCENLTSSDVADVIRALPKLHSLSIAGDFPLFTSTTLMPLGELSDIISLNLEDNPAVNDDSLDAISRNCHRIEELNISGARKLTFHVLFVACHNPT
jgi:F-box/leucine-rich repeat protein 2/20